MIASIFSWQLQDQAQISAIEQQLQQFCFGVYTVNYSVPDPNPPDPHVFWPPGSGSASQRYGSGSFYHHAKIVKKNLESYYFVTLFDFLSLKNNITVPSKSNKEKNCVKKLALCWHLGDQ
jgi:hypothetical protein